MKYKTLFRVLLKVLGVWFFAQGLTELIGHIAMFISGGLSDDVLGSGFFDIPWMVQAYAITGAQLIVGVYLFLGGRWIADMAIPGNRTYCHECGYTLTHHNRGDCPECGTPTGRSMAMPDPPPSTIPPMPKPQQNDPSS